MRGEWTSDPSAGREISWRETASLLASAYTDVDHHAPAVDIVDFEVPQFIAAHAGCIECGDNGPVLHVVGMVENAGNLFGAQYGRQPDPFPHPSHLFIKPSPVKRLHIQELQRGPMDLKRIGSNFPVFDQIQQVLPDLFRSQLVRRFAEILRKALDGIEVSLDGEIGIVTKLQLLQHLFS